MSSPLQRPEASQRAGDDAAAVAAALRGDPGGHRSLYDRHRSAVARVARGFADLDADDVEDVVQESFVRAFRNLAKLEQPARFGAWVLTIARNRALSRLARRRAGAQLADDLSREAETLGEPERFPDPDEGAELEVVRRIIAELPDGPEKETVHLFYVQGGVTAREIAARLGVGKSAITMRLERFRAKVKRRLLAEVARLRGEESEQS
ncbi:RNA polymerase sigma factor [Anaeromyxobacter oryzae]|uniref:RNA polymerase subunit sigma-24 n=1 Tax=Anaeromyxobacter oryzae TaxID=2918170 RepID=A0ABM7WQB1_9BACT|nr:sigma-70 family RNA polymerase sigma factor [Anaeromyxobacter oryzae]BDG01651.1 RNA polymerase subunit sigma-24 [Anaeromyxobacter oryzae]